jgi:hypothetical protein
MDAEVGAEQVERFVVELGQEFAFAAGSVVSIFTKNLLTSVHHRHDHHVITFSDNGIAVGMHTINQNDTKMLLWQLQIVDDVLHLYAARILAILLFEPARLEKADQFNVDNHCRYTS